MVAHDKRKKQLETALSTYELIVEEAERLIALKGVDGLRLSEIAELVGIQRPSLYSHFSGRSEVLTRIITRAIMDLKDDFEIVDELNPLENVRRGARALVRRLGAHPAHVRILLLDFASPAGLKEFSEQFGPPGELEESGVLRPLVERIGNLLRRGEDAGTMRRYDPLDFFHTILSVILVRLALDNRRTGKVRLSPGKIRQLEHSVDDLCVVLLTR